MAIRNSIPAAGAAWLCLILPAVVPAQNPQEPLVRITVNLVQVEAVVTDSKGRPVSQLKPADFTVLQDGKRQKITAFSYSAAPAVRGPASPVGLPPPGRAPLLRREDVRRTLVFVVDDLGLTLESLNRTREVLRQFVSRQMQPGDVLAIVRTSGGMGVLQQFTSDRARLLAAIDRISFFQSRAWLEDYEAEPAEERVRSVYRGLDLPSGQERIRRLRNEMLTVGTLGGLNLVVRGLRELPGRKSVVLFSESMRVISEDSGRPNRAYQASRMVADLANRASAVIHVIDPRRVGATGISLENEGLAYLARQTGGQFVRNDNDVPRLLDEVLAGDEGYYLIGYTPQAETFERKPGTTPFRKLEIRVRGRGLTVRYRHGFFGLTDEETAVRPKTALAAALLSPFRAEDLQVKLTPVFGHDESQGPFVTSLLHIAAEGLQFTEEPGGARVAILDTLVATFDESGAVAAQTARTLEVRVTPDQWENLRKFGLIYAVGHWLKTPGYYQMRAVVSDQASARIGSASRFIQAPDVQQKQLALGGMLLGTVKALTADWGGEAAGIADADPLGSPAVRIFQPGAALRCEAEILNVRLDEATRRPAVESQISLYYQGKRVYEGRKEALRVSQALDQPRFRTTKDFTLGNNAPPGEWALELVVTDRLAGPQAAPVRQVIDFEVAR
ncbi:MAG: VWA domain-containing protein [Bryobacterales bacterium]|nr:VWA domain-containing protein [Bryobacterales bacterium]